MVELDGMTPGGRGEAFDDGWDEGVTAASEALVRIADRGWGRRSGRSAGAAELTVHIADVRHREPAPLERFVRKAVLPRTCPSTSERRRVLEALGEAGSLCNARTVELSTGDVITCPRGHFDPDEKPEGGKPEGGKPGGWHHVNASMWDDSSAYSRPHTSA